MARVPFAKRENLTPEGQQIWDEFEKSRGGIARNYAALMNNPVAAGRLGALGGYARFESPLDARVKAVGVLTAAREAHGTYVWTVNQPAAHRAGLTDEEIAAIREFRAPAGLKKEDANVAQFVLELLRQHRISDHTYEALRAQIGDAAIIDLLVVVSYYHGLAHCLQALAVELPEGTPNALTY